MSNNEITIRGLVIECAIDVESLVSAMISFLTEINLDNAKTLNYHSFNLNFIQKIELLFDLCLVDRKHINKFKLFYKIRNNFAHIQEVRTFIACLELLEPKHKKIFLRKTSIENLSQEDQELKLRNYFQNLSEDLTQILKDAMIVYCNKIQDKFRIGSFLNELKVYSKNDATLDTFIDTTWERIKMQYPKDINFFNTDESNFVSIQKEV